jgi:hypothetical protein
VSPRLSVRQRGTKRLPQDGFLLNVIYEMLLKIFGTFQFFWQSGKDKKLQMKTRLPL